MLHDGTQFFDTHLETTITHETADGTFRCAKGGADGCWHAIAHGTQTATSTDAAFLRILEIPRGKELVLSNIGHKNGISLGSLSNGIHHLTHQQGSFRRMNGRFNDFLTFFLFEGFERITPLFVICMVKQCCDGWQRLLTIRNNCHISLYILIYLTMINIQMDHLRLLGIGF